MIIKTNPSTPMPDVDRIRDDLVRTFGKDFSDLYVKNLRNTYDDIKALEKVERVTAFPTANLDSRGKYVLLEGTSSGADGLFVCVDTGGGGYTFQEVTKGGSLNGLYFTNLAGIPLTAGTAPIANLPIDTDGTLSANSNAKIATQAATKTYADTKTIAPGTNTANNVPQWNGANSKTLKDGLTVGTGANNLLQLDGSAKLPAVDGSQLTNLSSAARNQLFTASGTFTTPAGVTKVYLTMCGGGGGGGGNGGGGGGGGAIRVMVPYTVTPGTGYGVTIGAPGTGGAGADGDGGNGGVSSFDTISANGGTGGKGDGTAGAGGTALSMTGSAGGASPGAGGGAYAIAGGSGGASTSNGAGGGGSYYIGGAGGENGVSDGYPGTGYGAGGGGGGTSNRLGGNGYGGFVLVEY